MGKGNPQLYSAFVLKCGAVDIDAVDKRIRNTPALKRLSYGSRLRYEILESIHAKHADDMKINPILEIDKSTIRLTFFFDSPNASDYSSNFIKLLSILALLRDCCTVEVSSLYIYFIELERGRIFPYLGNRAHYEKLEKQIFELSKSNNALADLYIDLEKREKAVNSKLVAYEGFLLDFINELKNKGAKNERIEDILFNMGIGKERISTVLGLLPKKKVE